MLCFIWFKSGNSEFGLNYNFENGKNYYLIEDEENKYTLKVKNTSSLPDDFWGPKIINLSALIGKNGSGKSVLLRAVKGLIPIEEGTIVLDGKNLLCFP